MQHCTARKDCTLAGLCQRNSARGAHEVGVALGQLVATLEEALSGLLQRGVGHQLLLPELCEVYDAAQVRPEARRLRLVQVLPRKRQGEN